MLIPFGVEHSCLCKTKTSFSDKMFSNCRTQYNMWFNINNTHTRVYYNICVLKFSPPISKFQNALIKYRVFPVSRILRYTDFRLYIEAAYNRAYSCHRKSVWFMSYACTTSYDTTRWYSTLTNSRRSPSSKPSSRDHGRPARSTDEVSCCIPNCARNAVLSQVRILRLSTLIAHHSVTFHRTRDALTFPLQRRIFRWRR